MPAEVAVAEILAQRDGSSARTRAMSTIGRCVSGMLTPGRRVHGKFSIHEPCDATGSMACTFAHVRGAFHQLWKSTRQPR